jgi:outer membrane protein assembly factor BamB
MQKILNKNKAISIALITILTISFAFMLTTQTADARPDPYNLTTYCYVQPNEPVVGVGQQVLLLMWLNAYPPTASGAMGDRWTFYLDIMKPDGTNDTIGPITSDPVGSAIQWYTPTETGVYTIVSRFIGKTLTGVPGQTNNVAVNDTYAPSTSKPNTFTVQQDPIPGYAETPLPSDYWTRPVYDTNKGWGMTVMGQWLGGSYFESLRSKGIPNTAGPQSSHVLWTRSYWLGGVMGGYVDTGFYNGIAYEGFSSPILVLEGKAYYSIQNPPRYGYYCIDIYTGETIYYENATLGEATMPTLGQVLNYDSPNQHGGFSYLWRTSGVTIANPGGVNGTIWEMLDAFTGNSICKIANVSTTGTQFRDSIGSICYINFNNLGSATAPNYYLQIWNTTQAIWWRPSYGIAPPATLINGTTNVPTTTADNSYWFWRPGATTVGMSTAQNGAVYNGLNGYTMNLSVANIFGPRNSILNETGSIRDIVPDQYVVIGTAGRNDARGNVPGFLRAVSLKQGEWGTPLWDITFSAPKASDDYPNATANGGVSLGVSAKDGVFWFTERNTGKIWMYSIETGTQLWTYQVTAQFASYGMGITVSNGKAYTIGSYGVLDCLDVNTGEFLWNFTAPSLGYLETQGLEHTPLSLAFFINDPSGRELLYLHGSTGWAGESSPIRRDGAIFCVDTNTGELVWRLTAYPNTANNALSKVIISEGRIIYLDNHDNQIYCLGKGPSATTVSAPQIVPALGSSVTLTGTVTDQSQSGRHDINGNLDVALKGTPAISDNDMDAWMEYMFHQRPMPTNAKGVEVTLNAIDPNGNLVPVGNTTSDVYGNFGLPFTPEVPGTYQIFANFAGSNSYGPSASTTYLTVGQAPQSTTTPTPAPQSIADLYLIPGIIGVIITIIIVGAVIVLLLLRKHA